MQTFPRSFLWGASITGHQVEGNNFDSDWWLWEQRPGRIKDGGISKDASAHWDRMEQDIQLAKDFGHNALLLSIEWSRIQPEIGKFDRDALAHYRRVLQTLRNCEIEPLCVLNHVTCPRWFTKSYGWHHRLAPNLFEAYVARVIEELGDLCDWWIPIREPMHWITMAYFERTWPPGSRSLRRARLAAMQLGRAHARAYHKIRRLRPEAQIGIGIHTRAFRPANPYSPWDTGAARREQKRCNHLYLDALTTGRWPTTLRADKSIQGTFDFIGISYYGSETLRFAPTRPDRLFVQRTRPDGTPADAWDREISAGDFKEIIADLTRYDTPMIVIGNGIPTNDDSQRCRYILDHLAVLREAMETGADVRGYFHRALIDGFEWTDGYTKRYGLFHVDRDSKSRTPNGSAFLYKEICQTGAVRPGTLAQFCPGWEEVRDGVDS